MTDKQHHQRQNLTADIRRIAGDEPTRRYLRALPLFQPDFDMPDEFRDMLARMEQAEHGSPASPHRRKN